MKLILLAFLLASCSNLSSVKIEEAKEPRETPASVK